MGRPVVARRATLAFGVMGPGFRQDDTV